METLTNVLDMLTCWPGAGARLAEGQDVKALKKLIVECAWDREAGEWHSCARAATRTHPKRAMSIGKVMQSIQDNITQDDLHAEIQTGHG